MDRRRVLSVHRRSAVYCVVVVFYLSSGRQRILYLGYYDILELKIFNRIIFTETLTIICRKIAEKVKLLCASSLTPLVQPLGMCFGTASALKV